MEILKLLSIGLALGILVVIPGLSTGTMAVVFNVYDRLIGIITPNIKKIISEWEFWLPLVIGGAVGLAFISKVVTVMYDKYPFPITWFFIGVITGSLPLLYGRMKPHEKKLPNLAPAICALLALAVMIVMAVLKARYNQNEGITLFTEISPRLFILLVLAGIFSSIAMIIPGISGAFLLLIIGMYRTVIQSVSDFNIPLLLPLALGILVGLLAGAALVRFLLSKAPMETYGAVLGLVAGSIVVLFPGSLGEGNIVIISAVCFLAGAVLSFLLGNKKN
jgi:putative membrane protein